MRRFFGNRSSASSGDNLNNNPATPDRDRGTEGPYRGFGNASDGGDGLAFRSPNASGPGTTPIRSGSGTGGWGGFGGFGGGGMDQAKMELAVATASRSFGEGVQNIVVSAKARQAGKSDGEWKQALLSLLGQGPPVATSAASASPDRRGMFQTSKPPKSDIDILLENSACDKFVLRCVENELPPNLIHCLRLLRVLELQNAGETFAGNRTPEKSRKAALTASSSTEEEDGTTNDSSSAMESTTAKKVNPVSQAAAAKVAKLLCLLCTDSSVGEQLRPHLFGLLALSGASYPPTGVHVAAAASDVICQFANGCFTRNLVWFVHDRKMMVHMTDDVKELSAMASSMSSSQAAVPMGLSGQDAEKAGLLVIALRTVVKVVYESTRFDTVDLVRDFDSAGGYEVLHFAILHATGTHGKELLELLPLLACCPNEIVVNADGGGDIRKLACNFRVYDIMGDLLTRSNLVLRLERKRLEDDVAVVAEGSESESDPFIDLANPGDLREIAVASVRTAAKFRLRSATDDATDGLDVAFDLPSELLAITFQLFADHPNNYETMEGRLHILTYSVLAFPCYSDDDLKNFILKTIEFVLTAVGVGTEVTPIAAFVEIFFAMCHALLRGTVGSTGNDNPAQSLNPEEDQKMLDLIAADADLMGGTLEKLLQFDQRVAPLIIESGVLLSNLDSLLDLVAGTTAKRHVDVGIDAAVAPSATPLDKTFGTVCRVLKLLVSSQPASFYDPTPTAPTEFHETSLHVMFRVAVEDMGIEAAAEASGVFEAYLASFPSTKLLETNMRFALKILDDLSSRVREIGCDLNDFSLTRRLSIVLSMLRSVLQSKSLSRNAFRTAGGFDSILRAILSLKNAVPSLCVASNPVIGLLHDVVGLLDAAIGMKARNPLTSNEASPLAIRADVSVDFVSSQLSFNSASSLNRSYMRQHGFYLNFAAALAATGLLASEFATTVLDLVLGHIEPDFIAASNVEDILTIRNADAIRLAFGFALFLPDARSGNELSQEILDKILTLCEKDRIATTLPQIASCGLCYSLVNPNEFGPLLFDDGHSLQTRFALMLNRVAALNMSHLDFTGVLRNVAAPVIASDSPDGMLRLPVLSSSIKQRATFGVVAAEVWSEDFEQREQEYVKRLETICDIAKNSHSVSRVRVGGDSVNTIAVLMHKVRLEERLKATAEEGRLRFVEIESIDAAALIPDTDSGVTVSSTNTPTLEKLWTPLTGSGFSYSLWLRHDIPLGTKTTGNFYILDICNSSNPSSSSGQGSSFLSVWYDVPNQRFNVMSSASYRGEPTCFPVSPLIPDEWHHILVTYTPAKRSMIARKSVFAIYVDGRPLEAEVRVESVNLPPTSRVVIGAPNPTLAISGVVRGILPVWELGSTLLAATVLLDLDATAIYSYGPEFPGLLWGDRPQRLSLSATGTAVFSMLALTGESGSIATALRRRDISKLENVGYSAMGHSEKDDLSTLNLFCNIPPDSVVFGFLATTTASKMRNEALKGERRVNSERLVNLACLNYGNDAVSTDAMVYGKGGVISPSSFKSCLRWAGGPSILLPLVNAANTSTTLALALQMIRLGCHADRPNLEMMQAGGGYRILSVILQGKGVVDERCLDQCLAFAIHGFEPDPTRLQESEGVAGDAAINGSASRCTEWVFSDLDAMKHLLLNHQVWDLRKFGPQIPLRLLTILNRLVDHKALHKAFNARRLHQVGIVRWALHLAIEAAELYTAGDILNQQHQDGENQHLNHWYSDCPRVSEVSVGGDPGNPFLLECKNLLRRVLTFMLTPGDLEGLVESIVFTASINGSGGKSVPLGKETRLHHDDRMLPGPTMRLHLVRLLEELIVDGVNEIVASSKTEQKDDSVVPHAGGVASPFQPYFTTSNTRGRRTDGTVHPKHQQAQNFLSAFASFLTPVWFATVLESCQEEASASALLRLMILMLQGSSAFETGFRNAGSFSPFVLSIPKFSTCPGISMSMLSQLLSVPILHLHSLPSLDPDQLCEVFDSEGENSEFSIEDVPMDPSSGIFALLVECVGRNIQLVLSEKELAPKASATNQAIIKLLTHRHATSASFREYCCTLAFLEPLSQALCLVYDEKLQPKRIRAQRPSLLTDVPKGLTPTERFVGSLDDTDSAGMGIVRLVRLVVTHAVSSGPRAAQVITAIFRSFPIHATPQQVEAFHLVLIEHCCSVIDNVLKRGEGDALGLSNCIGICSVLLDHEVGAFFTSEAALSAVKTTISILDALLRFDTPAIYSLTNAEHSMLTRDAAYLANLICAATLKLGLPHNIHDSGDEDLQSTVLELMDSNMDALLLLPSRDRKSNRKVPTGKATKPAGNSKLFDIWESASIARCETGRPSFFPDYFDVPNADVVTLAPLLVSLRKLLLGSRDDVRSLTISIFVALLEHRSSILSELLVAEVERNGRVETIDVVNRGGFKALLAAHEASTIADNKDSVVSVKRKYASFFDWFEKKQDDVQVVFSEIDRKSKEVYPCLQNVTISHAEAVESEQKLMLMRLSSRSADRTMLGGLERAELARICSESTAEIHGHWKRQGFDDLAFGAMKWKILLRQLKGSCSIWEGGPRFDEKAAFSLQNFLCELEAGEMSLKSSVTQELVKRWKLDLTEGFERQRRRLLPNYEFHGLYNLDEENDAAIVSDTPETLTSIGDSGGADFLVVSGQMEATAELLKDLNIKRTNRAEDEDIYGFDDTEHGDGDTLTEATTVSSSTPNDMPSLAGNDEKVSDEKQDETTGNAPDAPVEESGEEKDSSSYELITGLLEPGDWPEKSYNVSRCTGLEVTKALLLWCGDAIYVIDGFEETGGGMEGKITRVERERSSFHINLRPKDFKVQNEKTDDELAVSNQGDKSGAGHGGGLKRDQSRVKASQHDEAASDVIYEHRSQRILLTDLYSVYRRRYQLQQNALEIYDVHRNSALIAFAGHVDREEVLSKILQSSIPNSIFSSSYGTSINYSKFMRNLQAKITSQWQSGKMSNFEYLMQLNSLAGRSFNDLTQYPVFPWIIADYESEELDLEDPNTYRDLSKPMGAIGEERAVQFRDRYDALASTYFGENDPPPFHYGTHYSCAAYVLYYLMRLEPFSRLALALQGGRFDVADRLFHDIGRSWRSASAENLQDVRELIPEFFYLPDFLENTNHFDFGETQRGKTVHDVSLPKWAKGDPKRFIRINRQALESEYVSRNLHHWIDLVFGYKQRGEKAVELLNTFVHVTYEGEVDIDSMEDPVQRQSTIAQIQNFGQTPSRLERYPFPNKVVPRVLKGGSIDFGALPLLAPLTPPFCVVGAPHRVHVKHFQTDVCKLGLAGQSDASVGDIFFSKGQIMGTGKMCTLNIAEKKYYRFGGLNNGLSIHTAAVTTRFREVNKLLTVHDDLHRAPILTAKASLNGRWLVTGCVDSTLRVWAYNGSSLKLAATLCGHDGAHIKCIDVSTECGVIASGCGQGRVILWDLRTLTFVRTLKHQECASEPAVSVSINHKNGNVVTLVGTLLSLFDINGRSLANHRFTKDDPPTCAASTDCQDWMDNGIVAVTGHRSGDVRLWSINYDAGELKMRQTIEGNTHSSPITVLCVTGVERQDTLLIGDRSGRISVCKTVQLDSYNPEELAKVVDELAGGIQK